MEVKKYPAKYPNNCHAPNEYIKPELFYKKLYGFNDKNLLKFTLPFSARVWKYTASRLIPTGSFELKCNPILQQLYIILYYQRQTA